MKVFIDATETEVGYNLQDYTDVLGVLSIDHFICEVTSVLAPFLIFSDESVINTFSRK